LARIGEPRIEGDQITATVETQTKLVKAELHYTLDPLPGTPNTRQWTSLPATIADGRIQSKPPPENATIWFLTVEDERKALVSSRLVVSSPLPPKD
jgi:hypothetical protein